MGQGGKEHTGISDGLEFALAADTLTCWSVVGFLCRIAHRIEGSLTLKSSSMLAMLEASVEMGRGRSAGEAELCYLGEELDGKRRGSVLVQLTRAPGVDVACISLVCPQKSSLSQRLHPLNTLRTVF